jgi:hypothetical protein
MWADRQAVEIFHLQFLRAFGARVDKNLYALKGGGNLRFFHRSIRFSEDIDLDLAGISVARLRNHVDRVLATPSFLQTLRVQQIELVVAVKGFLDTWLVVMNSVRRPAVGLRRSNRVVAARAI